jgi:hypothetical protein
MSFRNDFRIIFLRERLDFKRNYLKRQGQGNGATGPAQQKNGSWRWASTGRGGEMKKKKVDQLQRIEPKKLRKYRKGFLISRI